MHFNKAAQKIELNCLQFHSDQTICKTCIQILSDIMRIVEKWTMQMHIRMYDIEKIADNSESDD